MTKPYKHQRVLDFVNRIRKRLGKKPLKRLPKGCTDNVARCPIARGVGSRVFVNVTQITIPNGARRRTVVAYSPKYIVRFIKRFDRGDYPELVK